MSRSARMRPSGLRAAALVAGLMLAGCVWAAPSQAAAECGLAGSWSQTTQDVGSTSWSIQANGTAQETGIGNASGTASLSGGTLTINWTTSNGYAGTYRWTLDATCKGTGTLTFTKVGPGDDRAGKSFASTVSGPPPVQTQPPPPPEPPGGCKSGGRAAAINEVRVVAVQPGVQMHKAGTPEDQWCEVGKDTVLQQGDEISCDPDGAATLQFSDNSTVVVRNTTQLKIASFFTEGGVVKTEILLKMGEIAAKVHRSEATKSDFRINTNGGEHKGSVRGTEFSVFYDPGSRRTLWSVREGTVEATTGAKTVLVTAGKEVLATGASLSPPAPIGKAGARGGLNFRNAVARVMKVVAAANGPCKAATPRTNAYATKPATNGWSVVVKLTGKVKGSSNWTVIRGKVKPTNALAKKIGKRCR